MSWLVPAQTSERRLPFLYTSGFPVLNRSLFPGFHSPMTKSPYSATVQVTCTRPVSPVYCVCCLSPPVCVCVRAGVLAESRTDGWENQAICLYPRPGCAQPFPVSLLRQPGGEEHLLGRGEGGSWCWRDAAGYQGISDIKCPMHLCQSWCSLLILCSA